MARSEAQRVVVRSRPGLDPDSASNWLEFVEPVEILEASTPVEVWPALDALERRLSRGRWAAGFLTYEAAPAFDPAMTTHAGDDLPVLRFGIYDRPRPLPAMEVADAGADSEPAPTPEAWQPSLEEAAYRRAVEAIHRAIARGDTYQVNLTWRLEAPFHGDSWLYFRHLAARSAAGHAAYVELPGYALCSASPELFFELEGDRLTCRPMKGTAPRGLYPADDARLAAELRSSEKNRAENLMIVDMIRNDLGRIARPGSVRVPSLFDVETYPTVHQMTSTVTATSDASFSEILAALFPCASITGAPKIRTMEIIRELETGPRGIYTGTIGYLGPDRTARFNVAIRTVHLDLERGRATYGTGGGIVWDSDAEAELREGRTKTLVVTERPDYRLLETLRWSAKDGYDLLERHLTRLAESADLLGFVFDDSATRFALARLENSFGLEEPPEAKPHRVRLLVDAAGAIELQHQKLELEESPWTVGLALEPVNRDDRFLYHKTTRRAVYDRARSARPELDDVILWNCDGELTEATVANLALEIDGVWWTPPVASGLLAGTMRDRLLDEGRLRERILTRNDLDRATAVALVNSVRGWIPARLTRTR